MGAWIIGVVGPWLYRFAPWVAALPPLATVKRWAFGLTYVLALGLGAWGGAKGLAWWRGDQITVAEADARGKAKCDVVMSDASTAARVKALDDREAAILAREREAEIAEQEISIYATKLEADRAKLSSDDRPFASADDGWLLGWRREGR